MTNILSPFFLVSSIASLFLGIWVLAINTRNRINLSWFIFCLSVCLWSFGLGTLTLVKDESVANIFYFIHYIGAINIPIAFYYFVRVFFARDERLRWDILIGFCFSAFFLYAFTAGDLVGPLVPKWKFSFYTTPSKYYPLYMGYFSLYVLASFYVMLTSFRETDLISQRKRKLFLLIATACGYTGGSTAFLLVYIDKMPPYGILFFPIFPILTTYAIVRYRLMDVRILLTRTFIYLLIYVAIFAFSIFIGFSGHDVFVNVLGNKWWWLVPAGIFAVFMTAAPYTYLVLQRRAEEYLFRDQKQYQRLLRQAAKGMKRITELDKLLGLTVHIVTKAMKVSHVSVFLYNKDLKGYELSAKRGYGDTPINVEILKEETELAKYLNEVQKPLVSEEVELQGPYKPGTKWDSIQKTLDELNASVLVPSFSHSEPVGFLILGNKKDTESFSEDDVSVLDTLADQAGFAIENCRFIAEIEQTQMQLFQAAKMNDLGTMASGIGHQINNRLNKITIASDICKKMDLKMVREGFENKDNELHSKGVEAVEKHLTAMAKNAHDGSSVVRNLLDFSRLSTGFEDVSISQAVEVSVDLLGCKRELKKINFTNNVAGDLPTIYASKSSLQEVIFNLLDNGFDAILLKEEARSLDKLPKVDEDYKESISINASLKNREGEEWMVIEVEDTGIGMEPETVEKLYVPFFTTKATVVKGTGLGVYVMKKMVDAHNGKIEVDSEYGKGTAFRVWFPLKQKKDTDG